MTTVRSASVAAAVDIGSNSVHLLAAVVSGHQLEPLVDESVLLGLGASVDAEGRLGPVRRGELTAVLVRYVETARRLGARNVTLIGTEPLRRAADAGAAVAEAEAASGEPLFVLSHEEEAFLTRIGVTLGREVAAEVAVIDVGGGSSEVAFVGPGMPARAGGILLGSARLTARLVQHDPPTAEEIAALRAEAMAGVAAAPQGSPRELVAVGGTATNLLRVVPASALDRVLTRARLAEAMAILATEPFADASTRHAVNLVRARILPAGAAILEALLVRYHLDRLRVSDAGVREGAIFAVERAGAGWRDSLAELAEGWA
jgi:exopolyphosphatase/pppGpp-phosphohydrolase